MINIYVVKVNKKYLSKLIKYRIFINKIKVNDDDCYLYLDEDNYLKVKKYSKLYNIEFIRSQGLVTYKNMIKKYYLFFMMFLFGISLIIFLSNIIFEVEIKINDKEIYNLVRRELEKYDITEYKLMKNYNEKEYIRSEILKNNKDKLEWMEIDRVGSKYIINLEKRVINNNKEISNPQDIVALKNAIILSIDATSGNIIRKLNEYVKKGDVIVTGNLTRNNEVVARVPANAIVYGETWYNVSISMPLAYYEKSYTGKEKKVYTLELFGKKIRFFDKENYIGEDVYETNILNNSLIPIRIYKENIKEVILIDDVYTIEEAYIKALEKAEEKLLLSLPSDSKILSRKKLKIVRNSSTIDVDVFFKVYENITDTKEIILTEENIEGD